MLANIAGAVAAAGSSADVDAHKLARVPALDTDVDVSVCAHVCDMPFHCGKWVA